MTINLPLSFLWAIRKESSKTQILWMRWLAFGEELKNHSIIPQLIKETPNLPESEVVNIYEWGMKHLDGSPFFTNGMEKPEKNTDLQNRIQDLEDRVSVLEQKIVKKNTAKEPHYENYDQIVEILTYLNEKTGSNYLIKTPKNREYINARLKEGFPVEVFKDVIDKKTKEWKGTQMEKYLRPATLFNSEKFESYVNQKGPENSNSNSKNINNLSNAVSQAKGVYGISPDK